MAFLNLGPEVIIINLIVLLVAMTVHEFMHNYVGYLMGDPTPKQMGRLTLNPFVHINWMGWIMFALIGFGVLGSAPIQSYRMRNPRWGMLAAVAAGPLSNLALAILGGIVFKVVVLGMGVDVGRIGILFIQQWIFLNVLLFVFNLLPLFPVDGWHITLSLLPANLAIMWDDIKMYTYYAFIGIIFYSIARSILGLNILPDILDFLIGQPTRTIFSMIVS